VSAILRAQEVARLLPRLELARLLPRLGISPFLLVVGLLRRGCAVTVTRSGDSICVAAGLADWLRRFADGSRRLDLRVLSGLRFGLLGLTAVGADRRVSRVRLVVEELLVRAGEH